MTVFDRKSAALLRMMSHAFTPELFKEAVGTYLKQA